MSAFLRGVRRGSRLPGARLGGLLVALALLVASPAPCSRHTIRRTSNAMG